ncbi:MAG: gliding motility-associated ABC transporter substrate-binding protein GldG [Bacteroidales bacterium]
MADTRKDIKRNNIIQLLLGLMIIVLLNVIGSFLFTRLDLTAERRYSLSDATKKMLRNLDDVVYFKVYLEGEFPAGFKRLRNETREMLDEFRAYSDNIQYEFINPSGNPDKRERNNLYQQLVTAGLNPTDLQVKTNDGTSRQVVFPGALITYKNRELPLELLNSQIGVAPEQVLNNSVQQLEYNISSVIRKLSVPNKPKLAFIIGHGELSEMGTTDIRQALGEYYTVERIKIDGKINSLSERVTVDSLHVNIRNKYKAIIIAKPDSAYNEKDKFIIDQFVMRGGKVLWLIDPVDATMDSLQNSRQTVGALNETNLEDQLFNYGVRLNGNLLVDISCLPIPMVTGMTDNKPQTTFVPWFFFPVIIPTSQHPIVRNLNAVKCEFASSLDTIVKPGIKKTLLLTTSKYSRALNAPVIISLDMARQDPDPSQFNQPNQHVAVLLEGKFESLFLNRIPPAIAEDRSIGFLPESEKTAMIIVSDGDVIRNQVRFGQNGYETLPLGFDRFTGQSFGNKDFIMNAINYLCDDSGLISARSRELKLRMLDITRIKDEKLKWQLINVILPIVLVVLFGFVQNVIRRRRYSR